MVVVPLRRNPPVEAMRVTRYWALVSASVNASVRWSLRMTMIIFMRDSPPAEACLGIERSGPGDQNCS
jgi:hypothetical protein